MSTCTDCLDNCGGVISTDKCIKYTGPEIPLLGICTGDSLFEYEAAVVAQLEKLVDGSDIIISDLDLTCNIVRDTLGAGTEPTLFNLIQALITIDCSYYNNIQNLNAVVFANFNFNLACLTGLTGSSTRDEILQAVITKLCSVNTRVTAIESDYVKATELCAKVSTCLAENISTQYNSRMVPGVVYPYQGSLSNFDNTGKGLSSAGFDKVYLCNGLNGTKDWRGRSPIGAVNNVPGGTLDAAVDPSLITNAGTNYNLHQKVGTSNVTLTTLQIPSHTHGINDPGHTHQITGYVGGGTSQFSAGTGNFWFHNPDTEVSTTGILLNPAGGGQPHTNVQPSIACYYIIYLT